MQIERTEGGEHQCWLNAAEADAMIDIAEDRSRKHHVVVAAGLKMGLRPNEFCLIRPCDMHEQVGTFFLRICDAKDTRADGKSRDAYRPGRSNTSSSDSSRPKALTMMNSSWMFTNHASAKWYARLRTTSPMTL